VTAELAKPSVPSSQDKPLRKFRTYEEYVKEFFPKGTEGAVKDDRGSGDDFGVALAMDSLTKHAEILRFGR
jgi:hypothetical protein